MKKLLGIVVLGLLLFSTVNSKEVDSSKFLLDACKVAMSDKQKSENELLNTYLCKFYFKGAWENAIIKHAQFEVRMESMGVKTDKDTFLMLGACIPTKTTLNQFINIFINHMERNPQKNSEMAMLSISDAANEIFPCKK
tara:strand:+ start:85 stop:501 length:417 start_codon:yes stop_codon:yes gene_type:complete